MHRVSIALRVMAWAAIVVYAAGAAAQSEELFPRPAELEPAVQFWIRVYTEVDTQSGFLHDAENLAVIYRSLPLDTEVIESNRKQIQDDLKLLASGRRDGLTPRQQEILSLWPSDVSNATLANAAGNVRWQLGQSDRFLSGLQRSGAYRAHINQVIRERNLPLELGVLPHVESSFNPNAFSSASAAGMWQFGSATGKRFMQIDHIVDERLDPYIATYAAMSLLEYNYSILGTWPLALTAYNHGAGGMARAVRELGTNRIERIVADYKGRAFGFASRNFYAQFLAVIEVENNARKFFGEFRLDAAPEFLLVTTDAFIEAESFASALGISLEQLREDNRALRSVVWDGSKRIPKDFTLKVRRSAVSSQTNLLALVPADARFNVQTPDVSYTVVRGDSLSVIARRFNTTVSRLVSLNQLTSSHRISIGQRLLLPQDSQETTVMLAANETVLEPRPVPVDGLYDVRPGDSLSLIATRLNVSEAELMQVNRLSDPHRIYPGQQLAVPGSRAAPVQGEAVRDVAVQDAVVAPDNHDEVALASLQGGSEEAPLDELVGPIPVVMNESALLPPAAVLPDDQNLQAPGAEIDEREEAEDVRLTVEQNNERLVDALAVDPSDYSVAGNSTIEIQAAETLGHYADWLGLRTADLRRMNNMSYSEPVIIGERLKLDFSKVSAAQFEVQRREFHLQLQQEFFSQYRIQDVQSYLVKPNDNLGSLARNRYSTPMWLLRQYNPQLDLNRIQIGQEVVFPLLEPAG